MGTIVDDHRAEVSEVTRQKLALLGEAGAAWLTGLPELLSNLGSAWFIAIGQPLPGGTAAFVSEVRTADGGDAVLKLAIPEPGFREEVETLARASGRGYARLLVGDDERGAMLLERLGPSMADLGLAPEEAIEKLCLTLREAWTASRPEAASDPAQPSKAERLAEEIGCQWRDLDEPCPRSVIDQALRFAERRATAFDPARSVVIHGDPHPANALRVITSRAGAESGFVFVDPDGFVEDPTYDLGVILRDWGPQLLEAGGRSARQTAESYCELLATHSGQDRTAIWEWGFLERVSTGLYLLELREREQAKVFLDTARLLV